MQSAFIESEPEAFALDVVVEADLAEIVAHLEAAEAALSHSFCSKK
jgi:hypothetical protein